MADPVLVRGIVVDNNDPQNRGRVKIRIPSYHGIANTTPKWINDEDLPWAMPGIFANAGNDIGQRLIPTIGTRLFILFEDGELSKPVYIGGIPQLIGQPKIYNANNTETLGSIDITTDDTVLDIDYTHDTANQGIVFKSLKGFTIYFDDTDGYECVKIIDQAGQMIKMESIEPITTRRGNGEKVSNGKITITTKTSTIELTEDEGINFII